MFSMYKTTSFLALGSFLTLAGCSADMSTPEPDPGALQVSGSITQDTAWEGTVNMVDETVIEAGVTVSVAPGTTFKGAQNAILRVYGTLNVNGTATDPVTMNPLTGAPSWGGITVESGGEAGIAYATGQNVSSLLYCKQGAVFCALDSVEFSSLGTAMNTSAPARIDKSTLMDMDNGAITVGSGGDLTITDSYVLISSHDLIVTSGSARLTVDYTEIGDAQGAYEHCNFHIGGAEYLSITNSNLIESVYAMMIGNTTNAVIQYNNIIDNDNDILDYGTNTGVDMRYNYWSKGAPNLGAVFDTTSAAASAYEQAGPRI